jgi:ADP-ribose pyrophosphatase YjhB (NUDIX family)
MPEQIVRCYASAGGVVVDPATDHVLVLIVSVHVGPDGLSDARLPKGHIELGESRGEAAVREVFEETGLAEVEILADLGHQTVEFDDVNRHTVRDESYFLMLVPSHEGWGKPEPKYERSWLSWDEAVSRLTYEPEREWVRRARQAWVGCGIANGVC